VKLGTVVTPDRGLQAVALRDGELVELGRSLGSLLAGGRDAISKAVEASTRSHRLESSRLGPAAGRPGKIMCIGRNYAEHAHETGHDVTARPEVFLRTVTSLAGPYDDLIRPAASEQMDYEVELAVVIGSGGRRIDATEALAHVGGYCVFNDVSIRDFQLAGTQWTPGKNFDGTGPLGPFVVTSDEIDDPQALELTTTIIDTDGNEEILQRSNTSLMVHGIADLIAFLSVFTTLEPGDVIATGTPSGVGMARTPQRWLVPGETVRCAVEKIGEIKNRVVSETSDSA
jgi:2-keto-4-pentenoate hydratase/2-oxohepta-3-ene-1,7-dioic acid hydratase in catechol pathway